jgi:hypothetical protein
LCLIYTQLPDKKQYKKKGRSMLNQTITILKKYPDVPEAQKYMKIVKELKEYFE